METSEVLHTAADIIQQRGWMNIDGDWQHNPWGSGAASTAPLCIEGAIGAALGMDLTTGSNRALTKCPAYRAVHEYVRDRVVERFPHFTVSEPFPLFTFNDSVAESADEVIEVLRAAAEVERLKEHALIEELVVA